MPERQTGYIEDMIATSRDLSQQYTHCDLTIVAEGGSLERSSLGLVEDFVHPTPVRFVDRERGYIIPAQCTIYVTLTTDSPAHNWLVADGASLLETVMMGSEMWHFYYVPGTNLAEPAMPLASWQNGLTLIDWEVNGETAANQQLALNYTWQVAEAPVSTTHYHFFNHVIDEMGQLVTQEDAAAIESLYWQEGDQLVTQFYLQLPPDLANGRYTLLTGLYTWPDLQRIPLNDDDNMTTTYLVTMLEIP